MEDEESFTLDALLFSLVKLKRSFSVNIVRFWRTPFSQYLRITASKKKKKKKNEFRKLKKKTLNTEYQNKNLIKKEGCGGPNKLFLKFKCLVLFDSTKYKYWSLLLASLLLALLV